MTDTQTTTATYVNRIWIHADRERVWTAITDSEWNGRYGYGCPGEFTALAPGGAYSCAPNDEMRQHGAPDVILDGEIIEIDPPKKLVQTWRTLFDPQTLAEPVTRLTWELEEQVPGITVLTPGCWATQARAAWAGDTSNGSPATSSENSTAACTPVS